MANEFIRESTDDKLNERNVSTVTRSLVTQYRAEARFLRALSYWHGIDLFGDIPFIIDIKNDTFRNTFIGHFEELWKIAKP